MMATATAQGKTFNFPEGTSPQQMGIAIDEFFASQQPTQAQPVTEPERPGVLDIVGQMALEKVGELETGATIATGVMAEPVSGLVGLGAAALNVLPGVDIDPSAAVRGTQRALTFQPITEAGQRRLQRVGGILEPVAKGFEAVEEALGGTTLEATGSPALAAAAGTLPTAIMEALGLGLARKAVKVPRVVKQVSKIQKTSPKRIENALIESAPNIDQLKDASRAVYKELDDLGVKFRRPQVRKLKNQLQSTAKKGQFDDILTPKTQAILNKVVKRLNENKPIKVSDIEDLRQSISKRAASALDPADSSAALELIDDIDLFLDRATSKSFIGQTTQNLGEISARYKVARNLWGRARRSEMISDAFAKADRSASGLENGIRVQLRQILNSKKKSRFFTEAELSAMNDVVKGTNQQNVLKLIGRLGFSEGQATNILGGLGGLALGGAVGGPAGATTVSALGQFSRRLAQKATVREARLADAVVRAGDDGKRIVQSYLSLTPPPQRSAFALSELLLDADVSNIINASRKLTREAAEIAKGRRALRTAGAAQAGGLAAPLAPRQAEE